MGIDYANRTFWKQQELQVVRDNAHLTAKELAVKLGKSEVAVDAKRRQLLGSNGGVQRLKSGWGVSSEDLAYVLGAVCADGTVQEYNTELLQKAGNEEMFEKVCECCVRLFGKERVKISEKKVSWEYKGVKKCEVYSRVNISSKEFYRSFKVNKVKENEEWISIVNANKWVEEEKYFWYFIGGLYDGDGSLARKNVKSGVWWEASIGVKPEASRKWLIEQLEKRRFKIGESGDRIIINGGQEEVERFIYSAKAAIRRKTDKTVLVGGERAVREVARGEAEEFVVAHHYLKSLPVGVVNYGLFVGERLSGVASYGVVAAGMTLFGDDTNRLRELSRLVLSADAGNMTDKSLLIGRSLKELKKRNPELLVVFTYADIAVGHVGRVYLSANGLYLGTTGEQVGWELSTGKLVSGRHAVEKVVSDAGVKQVVIPGKRRFCFILRKGGLRKKIVQRLEQKYGACTRGGKALD